MRLTRIYQPQALNTEQIINLSKEAAGHLIRVLRLQVGDEFIVFNGQAGEFRATIIELNKSTVSVKLGEFSAVNRESPLKITLAQAVLRWCSSRYFPTNSPRKIWAASAFSCCLQLAARWCRGS